MELLKAGADVNARDIRGETPLWWAADICSDEAVAALLEAGEDPAARGHEGKPHFG